MKTIIRAYFSEAGRPNRNYQNRQKAQNEPKAKLILPMAKSRRGPLTADEVRQRLALHSQQSIEQEWLYFYS